MPAIVFACSLMLLADDPDGFTQPWMFETGTPACSRDTDCPNPALPLCDTNTGLCVECFGPEHCEEGWTCTMEGRCHDACMVDGDCEGIDGQTLCDTREGLCVECLDDAGCPSEQYCADGGLCMDDSCPPGEEFCLGNTTAYCHDNGGSVDILERCGEAECMVIEGDAQCVGPSGSSGDPTETADGSTSANPDGMTGGPGGSATGQATGGTGNGDGDGQDSDDKGCACQATPPHRPWVSGLGLLVLALVRRRR